MMIILPLLFIFFFFNDTATTEIYTLSLHDALPICGRPRDGTRGRDQSPDDGRARTRSEEHTSELQSPCNLVCRLLLEKKKKQTPTKNPTFKNKNTQTPSSIVIVHASEHTSANTEES